MVETRMTNDRALEIGSGRCRRWLLAASVVLLAAATGAKPANDRLPPRGTTVALINLKEVFDNHPSFMRRTEELKQAVETFEAELKAKRDEISELQRRLASESMPKAQREKLESQVRDGTKALSLEVTLAKKVFIQREAAVYASIYQDVQHVIREYMQEHGIDLVIRRSDHLRSDDVEQIEKRLNAPIVCFADHLDITDAILARCVARERLLFDEPVEAPLAD